MPLPKRDVPLQKKLTTIPAEEESGPSIAGGREPIKYENDVPLKIRISKKTEESGKEEPKPLPIKKPIEPTKGKSMLNTFTQMQDKSQEKFKTSHTVKLSKTTAISTPRNQKPKLTPKTLMDASPILGILELSLIDLPSGCSLILYGMPSKFNQEPYN